MPATARSNDFGPFIRKIGYSVGLESLLERTRDFAETYGTADVFGLGDVVRLVRGKWNLKTDNVVDVLSSLRVMMIRNGEVAVLEVGDTLGIAWRLRNEIAFEPALRLILTHAIILADGDIFLNGLASGFDESDFRRRIEHMVEHKWTVLERLYQTPQQRSRIYKTVNIDLQPTNAGSRGQAPNGIGPLTSAAKNGKGPLGESVIRPNVQISADYIRKVLPRRRAWAVSLGLATPQGEPTALGAKLLQCVSSAGLGGPGAFALWPLEHEARSPILTEGCGFPRLTSWAMLLVVGRGLDLVDDPLPWTPEVHEEAICGIQKWFRVYWSLNQSKRMIRNQLLARVAYRLAVTESLRSRQLWPMPEVFEHEMTKSSPRITARRSDEAELTLALR